MPPLTVRSIASLLFFPIALTGMAAELTFSGNSLPALTETPPSSTGLTQVYVLPAVAGVRASFESPTGNTVRWQRFSALGGGYAQDVPSTQTGNVSTLTSLEGDMGYIVSDGTSTSCFWVVDYSRWSVSLADLVMSPQTDCSTTWLEFDGSGEAITYYGITGVPQQIDRGFALTYRTLEFDEGDFAYREVTHTENLASLGERIHCTPPLCQTDFTLSGDKFSKAWGEEFSITSPVYEPTAVEARTAAVQTARDVPNEIKEEQALGGSGPAEITFRSAVTDAAVYHEWEIARDPDFNQVYLRYSDLEFTYVFREQGTSYVRLNVANDAATCRAEGETYQVYIGESSLKCPNAFSPGASEGVNDEWRVSYKSIIEFDCRIFDRGGRQLAHLTDPSQGWDGKIRGKAAPSGVYFYVIRATGADGKEYKLSGDINIIGYNKKAGSSATNTTN